MDPFFQAQIYQCPYFPLPAPRLTPYLATPIMTNAGAGPSNFISTPMVPIYGENLYSQTKDNSESKVAKVENIVQAPLEDSVDTKNAQKGFGAIKDEEETSDSDINTNALHKMDESVLQAFESPVIKTSSFNYKPKKRTQNAPENDTSTPNIKKKIKGKLKFV